MHATITPSAPSPPDTPLPTVSIVRIVRIVPIGMAGLVVLAMGLFLPQLADAFRVKNHIVSLGACGLILLHLARQPVGLTPLPAPLRLALLACFGAILGSSLAATQPMIAWQASLEIVPLGGLFWLLTQQSDRAAMACHLERAWLFGALAVALLALQQVLAPQWLDIGLAAPGKLAAFSTLGNPIWASLVLVVALPLAVNTARTGSAWFWLAPLLVLAALWATHSRQAWLAVVLMGWVALVWQGGVWHKRMAWAALLLLACALPLVDFSADAFHSLRGRLLIMRGAWQMFLDHPLTGVGLGHVGAAYPAHQAALLADPVWQSYAGHAAVVDDAHNEWVQWAATTGALGLGGFTLLCASVAWMGWRSTYVRTHLWHWYLGYLGLLPTLLFTGIQSQSALGLLLVCCLGVVLAGVLPATQPQSASRWTVWLTGAVTLVIAVLAGLWAQQDVRASYWEAQGDRLMQERDAWLAQEAYAHALAIDPARSQLLKKHASTLYLDGRYAEALSELAKGRRLGGDTGIALLEAEILARMGQDQHAITAYQAIVASFPQLLSPRFILGQLYYRQHQPTLARAEFQRVVDMEPSRFNRQLTQDKIQQQKQMAAAFIAMLDQQQ